MSYTETTKFLLLGTLEIDFTVIYKTLEDRNQDQGTTKMQTQLNKKYSPKKVMEVLSVTQNLIDCKENIQVFQAQEHTTLNRLY